MGDIGGLKRSSTPTFRDSYRFADLDEPFYWPREMSADDRSSRLLGARRSSLRSPSPPSDSRVDWPSLHY